MFTGIIEEVGEVLAWERTGDAGRLTVRAPLTVSDAGHGDSISVNGVCLTVVDRGPDRDLRARVQVEDRGREDVRRVVADQFERLWVAAGHDRHPVAGLQRACEVPHLAVDLHGVGIGVDLDVRRPYAGDRLPDDVTGHAGLVVLGGEMGAYDTSRYTWLGPTQRLIADAVVRETLFLGICLYHQTLR